MFYFVLNNDFQDGWLYRISPVSKILVAIVSVDYCALVLYLHFMNMNIQMHRFGTWNVFFNYCNTRTALYVVLSGCDPEVLKNT